MSCIYNVVNLKGRIFSDIQSYHDFLVCLTLSRFRSTNPIAVHVAALDVHERVPAVSVPEQRHRRRRSLRHPEAGTQLQLVGKPQVTLNLKQLCSVKGGCHHNIFGKKCEH